MRTTTSPQSRPSHAEPHHSNSGNPAPAGRQQQLQQQQQIDEDGGDDHESPHILTHADVTNTPSTTQLSQKQTPNIQKIDYQGQPHPAPEEEHAAHQPQAVKPAATLTISAPLKRERTVTFDPSIPTGASDIAAVTATANHKSNNDNTQSSSTAPASASASASASRRPSSSPLLSTSSSPSSSSSSPPLYTLLPPRTRCPALPPLIPPFRYCAVEDGVYRGAYPSLKNLRFMQRLRLRTVVSLVPERDGQPTRDLADFCLAHGVRHVHYQVDKYDDGFSHTDQLVASIVAQLIDPANHPLFIHCRDGAHNTGIVVMCLRRLQNWTLQAIYDEFVRYTKSNAITFEEKQFVESFHAKVIIPPRIPSWLWDGVRRCKHPCIQLVLMPQSPVSSNVGENSPYNDDNDILATKSSPSPTCSPTPTPTSTPTTPIPTTSISATNTTTTTTATATNSPVLTAPTINTTAPNHVHSNPPSFLPPPHQQHPLAQNNDNTCTPPTTASGADPRNTDRDTHTNTDLDRYNRLETAGVFDADMAMSNHHPVAHDMDHVADANLVDRSIPFSWRHTTNAGAFDVLETDLNMRPRRMPVHVDGYSLGLAALDLHGVEFLKK